MLMPAARVPTQKRDEQRHGEGGHHHGQHGELLQDHGPSRDRIREHEVQRAGFLLAGDGAGADADREDEDEHWEP